MTDNFYRPFLKGDIVKILPEFQDPGDDEYTWVVMTDEEKGRVDICPIDIQMNIKPWSTVEAAWIVRS